MKTYVVNLQQAIQRRQYMQAVLAKHPYLDYSFVEAVNGKEIEDSKLALLYSEDRVRKNIGRTLSRGEIGCALSHVNIYSAMIERGEDAVLVLEDDIYVPSNIQTELLGLQWLLGKNRPVVVLLTPVIKASNRIIHVLSNNEVLKPYEACYTSGYLLNKRAATELLKLNFPVCVAADDWEYFNMMGRLDLYCLKSHVINLAEHLGSELEVERQQAVNAEAKRRFGLKAARKRKRRLFRWGEWLRGKKIVSLNDYGHIN